MAWLGGWGRQRRKVPAAYTGNSKTINDNDNEMKFGGVVENH